MMNQCINNITPECDFKKKKIVKNATMPTFQDVENYFSNPQECFMRVVYMKSGGIGNYVDVVKYKIMHDCVRYFTVEGNYFYVYINLTRNTMVWSAHPLASGVKGVIGHHITIGMRADGQLDIHETMYEAEEILRYHIIARKVPRRYFVHNKTFRLVSKQNPPPHYAPKVWDEILHYMTIGGEMEGGMGKADPKRLITHKNPREHKGIAEIFEIITQRLEKVKDTLRNDDKAAFIRIPYIPLSKEDAARKRLDAMIDGDVIKNMTLVSDHAVEYSVLWVNT